MRAEYSSDVHAFETNEGKAVLGGMGIGVLSAIPLYGALIVIDPNGSIREQQKEVDTLERQQQSLENTSSVLTQQGNNELAAQVTDVANQLEAQSLAVESRIPPHLTGDIEMYGLLLAPALVGVAAGAALYRHLKKQNN